MNWQINISSKDIKYVLNSCKNKFVETILKAWVEIIYKQITPLTDVNSSIGCRLYAPLGYGFFFVKSPGATVTRLLGDDLDRGC